jgi:hypothetical protein
MGAHFIHLQLINYPWHLITEKTYDCLNRPPLLLKAGTLDMDAMEVPINVPTIKVTAFQLLKWNTED